MTISYTIIIIIITAAISFAAFSNKKLEETLIFFPPAITNDKQWYRFFSCGLIHADISHLAFNMLALFMMGRFVEVEFLRIFGEKGKLLYLLMYVLALAISLLPTYWKNKNNYSYRSLGASGAVSAVIFAGILLNPFIELNFLPGFIFGPIYLIITAVLDKRGGGNINHSAHLWGALFGIVFIIVMGKLVANYNVIENFIQGAKDYWHIKFG